MFRPAEWLLERPVVYRLSQTLLAPGAKGKFAALLRDSLPQGPDAAILDLGCGSQNYGRFFEGRYLGVDCNPAYIERCSRLYPGEFRCMDATELDLEDASFDAAFSVGLCHHLTREQIRRGFAEWRRVLKPGGPLLIVDGILPLSRWNLPGWILRKMDRGAHLLPWAEWRQLFEELAPGAEFSTFSVFPYDLAMMRLEPPREKRPRGTDA